MRCIFDELIARNLIKALKESADKAVDETFNASAPELEMYAKQHAPWTDRTGRARRRLSCGTLCIPYQIKVISVMGAMSYSPGLELMYGGRYSILYPTILKHAEKILKNTANAVGGASVETA